MHIVNRVQQIRSLKTGATWWVLRAGRTAIFAGLHGRGFYSDISTRIFDKLNVDRIICEIPEPHYRLMRINVKDINIKRICEIDYADMHLVECELTKQ